MYITYPKVVPATICHCRESSVAEIRRLANNGQYFVLAQYHGELYTIRPDLPSLLFVLCHDRVPSHRVALMEVDALFAACYDIRYQGIWYPCDMFGRTPEGKVCVIADDPMNTSGLATRHSHYMWGSGVEFLEEQIEAVRLWMSDPIDPMLFVEQIQ